MGNGYDTSAPTNEAKNLQAYSQYLPTLLQQTAQATPETAQQQLIAANQMVNPVTPGTLGSNALNLQQLQQYALPEAQVGQQVTNANALAGAATNAAQIAGPGGQAATNATQLNQRLNPNYYSGIDAATKGATGAVNAINLNGLSPGEYNSVERSLNQTNTATGNAGLVNPTNIVSNAMNFGGAFNSKIPLMNAASGNAANVAGVASGGGGINPASIALSQPGQGTQSNFGSGQFANTTPASTSGAAGNAFNFSSGLLGNMTSANNTAINAGASMANATSSAAYLGSICCFIFMEAYHGKLPKSVRKGRDRYYNANHSIATGYRRMAYWLVPLMANSSLVRFLVWHCMVSPITNHLETPHKYKKLTRFWLSVWSMLGYNKCEADYCITWQYKYV